MREEENGSQWEEEHNCSYQSKDGVYLDSSSVESRLEEHIVHRMSSEGIEPLPHEDSDCSVPEEPKPAENYVRDAFGNGLEMKEPSKQTPEDEWRDSSEETRKGGSLHGCNGFSASLNE